MLEKLFADIDRARAEAAEQYAAGATDIPLPMKATGPAPHPAANRLGRLVLLVVVLATAGEILGLDKTLGLDLRWLVGGAFALPLLARAGSLVGLLPADLYRPRSWRALASRALFFAWYLAIMTWPVLLALSIPVLIALRWRTVHNLTLWAMKWQELRRLRAGKPPTAPITGDRAR